MVIHPNDILGLFEKEKRPLLQSDMWRMLGVKSIADFENGNALIVPDDQALKTVKIYIWVRKGTSTYSSTYTRRNEPYEFHPDLLEEFWFNELMYLLKTKKDHLDIKEIIEDFRTQLVNYYNLTDPLGESFDIHSDAGLGDNNKKNLLAFIDKHSDTFYRKTGLDKFGSETWLIGLVEWKDTVLDTDRKLIRNVMIKISRDLKGKSITLKELTYSVNRVKLDTLTPKPFNEELIKEIILQNSGRLMYDISKDTISLSDDLEFMTNYFKENRYNFNEFNFAENSSGLLAYIFIGKEFPLKEAEEYVKTRPVIFIDEIHYTNVNRINFSNESTLIEYLKAVMDTSNDEEIKKWLSENIALSYYEESKAEIKKIAPKIIEKFSPIFNLDNNPGNLFQYTLKSKLEEYYKKYPDKESPF